jgi:transposase-like protein
MRKRIYQQGRNRERVWQAWPIYLKTRSVTATARKVGVARQTVHRWLKRWFDEGSGDPAQDALMMLAAEGAADERAMSALTPEESLRLLRFELPLALRLERRRAALDAKEVVKSLSRREGKKLSQVLEDAAKKQRRSRK